ncbi:hypothetical protein BN1221_02254 [Brenneria goodwinii]|uniref:Uncharacterized protein n=1 Tax=Brenneria goodwinii TaxID=1109412 RepID=A0A0G4JVA7_9GAMM|nr:hypothetical protein BN1221_02254 [Brenneria goodwinii]
MRRDRLALMVSRNKFQWLSCIISSAYFKYYRINFSIYRAFETI